MVTKCLSLLYFICGTGDRCALMLVLKVYFAEEILLGTYAIICFIFEIFLDLNVWLPR